MINTPLWRDDVPLATMGRAPRTLLDFDNWYTAPVAGFDSALHYYEECSAKRFISNIRVHTAILAAEDDPMVAPEPFYDLDVPPNITLCMTQHGGHLGFIGRRGVDPDSRWMDWRVVDWLLN